MTKDYCFDLIGAYYAEATEHPRIEMEKLGFHIIRYIGQPIADAVFVRIDNAEEVKDVPLPEYVSELEKPYVLFEER